MTSQISSKPSLLNITDRIWLELFPYLPVRDRLSIRRTCRQFNETYCTYHIEKTEDVVFDGTTNTMDTIMSSMDHERKVWNVEFHDCQLDTSVLSFFSRHGFQVHSLIINDCRLEPGKGLLGDIIQFCRNLRNFSFVFSSQRYWYNITNDLESLWNNRVTCSHVENLTLTLCYPFGSLDPHSVLNEKFSQIFSIFPNVKCLDLSLTDNESTIFQFPHPPEDFLDEIPDTEFAFPLICDHIKRLRQQLEKFSLQIICHYDDYHSTEDGWNALCNSGMTELKELSLNFYMPPEHYDTIIDKLFFTFTNLTSFDCVIKDASSHHLELILSSAEKLRHLKITSTKVQCFFMYLNCFEALVRSKLITLRMYSGDNNYLKCVVSVKSSDLSDSLLPNQTLEQLRINCFNNRSDTLFSSYFPRLNIRKNGLGTRRYRIPKRSSMNNSRYRR